jgi:ferrous iron transport protein A
MHNDEEGYNALDHGKSGEKARIMKIGGKAETRLFLENFGFVTGGTVTVIAGIGGDVIVNVKDSRVAVSREMANRIMVQTI